MWQASTIFLTSWVLMMTFSLSVEQGVTSVVLRDNVTIFCTPFPITVTSWYGPDESGQRIRYTSQGQTLILDSVPQRNRLYIQVFEDTLSNKSSLIIANAMKTDAGTYACSDGKANYTFTVQVTDPNVTEYVTEGTQSVLVCPLTSVIDNLQWKGPPGVTVYNTRGTTRLNINGLPSEFVSRLAMNATGALIINNTQRSDDNLYKCIVGGPTNYVQLTVMVSPQNPVITNTTEDIGSGRRIVRATEDSQVTLVCQVRGGYPESSVKWLRGGMTGSEFLASNSSQHNPDNTYDVTSTVIVMARRSEDRVTYVCQAEHRTWTSPQNASVELYLTLQPSEPVMSDPGNLQENATLSSTCSVSRCRPAANIIWSGDGIFFTTNAEDKATETFSVTSAYNKTVTRKDNGATLQCTITHPALSSSLVTSRNLTVWFPPTSVSITNNREITAGDKLSLRCTTGTSNPITDIRWRNSTSAPTGELSAILEQPGQYGGKVWYQHLTITPTRYMDGNIITCSAENPQTTVPSVSDSVVLSVTYNPHAVISNGSLLHVKEGDTNLTLMCVSESKPLSSFTWIKDNVTLKTTIPKSDNRDTFTIVQVNRTHYGEYICIASNGISPNGQGNVSLHVQFSPINVSITNNKEVTAELDTLVLRCTTGTSNPTSDIRWMNGTDTPSGVLSTSIDEPGAYGGIVRYQDLTINLTRYMDKSTITCTAQNSANTGPSVSDSVILNVKFSPIVKVSITPNNTITEGDGPITIWCSASSKPLSYFTVTKDGLTTAISEGQGTQDNHHDYIIQKINRTYAGIYSCTAYNGVVGPQDDMKATVELVVQYPPDINVSASNVTTSDVRTRLLCIPNGVPDRYTFGTWQHLWPGYNGTLRSLSSTHVDEHTATLDLNLLSYQDSGIYVCQASNGVKVAGTQEDVITQLVYVLVKAPPVILNIPKNVQGGIGRIIAIQLDYYSNTDAGRVTLQYSNSSELYKADSVVEIETYNLPVYKHYVPVKVFRGNFNITINKQEDFGNYTVNVTNSIGFDVATLEIKPESEPGKPYKFNSSNLQKNQITLSWYPGFHGGFDQTFVIQISMDNILWQNASLVPGGKGEELINTTITELQPNTIYYFRIYAFNVKGNGELADDVISCKTLSELEQHQPTGPQISTIIGGAVGGGVAALAVIIVLILFLRQRTSLSEKSMGREHIQREGPESGLVDNPVYDTSGPLPGPSTGRSVAEYAVVVKQKKTAAQLEDPRNLYAQVDKKSMNKFKGEAKGKQGKKMRGDIYENADFTRKTTNPVNLYENSGRAVANPSGENVYEDPGTVTSTGIQVSAEGLLYADLKLNPPETINGKPLIRGIENRTVYAMIAYGKTGELLPDSDEEQQKTVDQGKIDE